MTSEFEISKLIFIFDYIKFQFSNRNMVRCMKRYRICSNKFQIYLLYKIVLIYYWIMKKYICTVCDWVYDPEIGDPEGGIEPGTAFEDIPEDWVCPVCGVGKDDFELLEEW